MMVSNLLFQVFIFRCHVSLPEGARGYIFKSRTSSILQDESNMTSDQKQNMLYLWSSSGDDSVKVEVRQFP